MKKDEQIIMINDTKYKRSELSKQAEAYLQSIEVTNSEIQRVQTLQNIAQVARAAYANALSKLLPQKEAHPNKKKDIITVNDKKYALEDFSDEGKAEALSLQQTLQRLQTLHSELAIAQTAKNSYSQALAQEVAK